MLRDLTKGIKFINKVPATCPSSIKSLFQRTWRSGEMSRGSLHRQLGISQPSYSGQVQASRQCKSATWFFFLASFEKLGECELNDII
jgi:hypothetical protein